MKHSTQQFLRLVVISIRVRPVQDYGRQKRRKRRVCRRWSRQRTWRGGDSLPLLRVLYSWKWVLREICLLWNAFDPCHIFGKFTIYNCMAQHFKVYVNIHLQIKSKWEAPARYILVDVFKMPKIVDEEHVRVDLEIHISVWLDALGTLSTPQLILRVFGIFLGILSGTSVFAAKN